ncbi:MAG: hypothetical protein JO030_00950 [Candidatus Eremiobacteraeota bacterium]|nr:hypothetical protein [Candidatus Eremiobacteraeota bacterium]
MTLRNVLRAQGGYYVLSGLFPLVSMAAFERVTGPKSDRWLVQTVGLLAASIGASLLIGALEEEPDPAVLVLAVTSALSFAGIDVAHTLRRRISPVYLADGAVQLLLTFMSVGAMVR